MSALTPEDDVLAAELALGLIEGAEKRDAEARLAADPAFAEAHARWQARVAVMFTDPGEAPRAAVWSAIEAQLPPDAADVARGVPHARLWFWQAATFVTGALAIVLGVFAVQKPREVLVRVPVAQAPAAPIVAVLVDKNRLVTVSFDAASGHVTAAASGLDIGEHSPQLWVIPSDGKPRSLGVIRADAPSWKAVPVLARSAVTSGVTIAVSVEPVGGSPTGQPTGPVILTGKMKTT